MRWTKLTILTPLLLLGWPMLPLAVATPRMTCQLSSSLVARGDTTVLSVFLDSATDVQVFQTKIGIVRTSGSGTVTVDCPTGVTINESRTDYIFFGLGSTSTSTLCNLSLATALLSSGGANAGVTPKYLVEYVLRVSPTAASNSTFEISVLPSPGSDLASSGGEIIPFTVGPPAVITVGPPTLSLVTNSCSQCVANPGSVNVALKVQFLDVSINGVQALFHYDPAILHLTSVTPGDGLGSPWDAASVVGVQDNSGDVAAALVLNGGQTSSDSTAAILHFTTLSTGATAVTFRSDAPPFYTKLTRASDNAKILPGKINAGGVIVGTRSKGDVNGDGLRNGADIQPFLDALFNSGGVSGAQACAADLNGNGIVDAEGDVTLLVDCLLNGICVCQ